MSAFIETHREHYGVEPICCTLPAEDAPRLPDLVERDFHPSAPDRLWVADLTYIPLVSGGFCYTAIVTDAFARAVVGWS